MDNKTLPLMPPAAALPQPSGWPLLRLGFRPFYLGAALFTVLAMPLWLAMLLGVVNLQLPTSPVLWHGHEMLFGFAVAVIVGFLLTAGKAWTGLATPRGTVLGGLAALWLAARIAAIAAPYAVYAAVDILLLPIVAAVFAAVLLRAGNRRNLPLVAILALLASANLVFHLAVLGVVDLPPARALHAALALIVMIECVIAGRVVPAFTSSATPGLRLTINPRLESATLAITAIALVWWAVASPGPLGAVFLALAAACHLFRQWQWRPWVSRSRPILWILHLAYAWLAVGFALLSLAQLGLVAASPGIHALAVGATGGLIIGMVTRTARGHTGRPLQASRLEVLAYALVMLAALARVFAPVIAPQWLIFSLLVAALAWSAAFAIYLFVFAPWLLTTRADGKDG
ncbi:NnrS family protein [Piscinibacter sakaiensis]|uniref:NnrS family protein n=1 Tax=Piscinibacter sakaiensis TaxID=1547922 RepID=UPI003AAD730C